MVTKAFLYIAQDFLLKIAQVLPFFRIGFHNFRVLVFKEINFNFTITLLGAESSSSCVRWFDRSCRIVLFP